MRLRRLEVHWQGLVGFITITIIAMMMSRADAGPKQLIAAETIAVLTGNTLSRARHWILIQTKIFGADPYRSVEGAWPRSLSSAG